MRIVFENRLIRQGGIGTKKYPKGTFLAHCTSRIGEQNHCVVNFVERLLAAIHHVGPAFHRYRVKTTGVERGSQVGSGGVFSFATNRKTTCEQLVEMICRELPFHVTVEYSGKTRGDQFGIFCSYEKIYNALGWEPHTSLKQGMQTTVKWALQELAASAD